MKFFVLLFQLNFFFLLFVSLPLFAVLCPESEIKTHRQTQREKQSVRQQKRSQKQYKVSVPLFGGIIIEYATNTKV